MGSGGLDVLGAILPFLVADPGAASMGVLATLGLSAGAKGVLGRRLRRRLDAMEAGLREMSEGRIPELVQRIQRAEEAAALSRRGIAHAADSATIPQATAYGRLVAHGLLERAEEEADFVMRALSRLGALEVRSLAALSVGRHTAGESWPSASGLLIDHVPAGLIDSVCATLDAAGLIDLHPAALPSFTLTPLGVRVARELVTTDAAGGV